jgi:hypothetical protein
MAEPTVESAVGPGGDASTTSHKRTHSAAEDAPNKAVKVIDAQYVADLEAQILEL